MFNTVFDFFLYTMEIYGIQSLTTNNIDLYYNL